MARWVIRFRFGAARPASSVTTRSVTADTIWKATIAATAATQPTRLLTGLWVPRISRKTTAATATRNPVAATLNVHLHRGLPAHDGEDEEGGGGGAEDEQVRGHRKPSR